MTNYFLKVSAPSRKKPRIFRFRHSRERGNPGKLGARLWTPAFAGVTDLGTFYETIKVHSDSTMELASFCLKSERISIISSK